MTRAAVLGAGSWGTAFATVLVDAGCDVVLWARRPELAANINDQHVNTDYLPGVALPPGLRSTPDASEALAGSELVVLAVPSQTLRENLSAWAGQLPEACLLVSLMKGIELRTSHRMSEVICEVADVPPDRVAVVSGPNLAKEIAARQPFSSRAARTTTDAAGSAPPPPLGSTGLRRASRTRGSRWRFFRRTSRGWSAG